MGTATTTGSSAPLTVLVVEDDPEYCETLCEVLEEDGYRTQAAAHGREALEHLGSGPAPALILLDLMMPVMDGWSFTAELKRDAALASIPVVVTSQGGNLTLARTPVSAGYLKKPASLDRLLHTIALCLLRTRLPPLTLPGSMLLDADTPARRAPRRVQP